MQNVFVLDQVEQLCIFCVRVCGDWIFLLSKACL
uniref:Uncharacterized protein n=1 Tax=Aegilops tauschii subsp. strangulata TaxID=200361 RepID=A0A453Q408_AEGTS